MDQTAASTASELSATPHSAPQASDATAGSSWEAATTDVKTGTIPPLNHQPPQPPRTTEPDPR